jgi:DNA-binding transcriptional LysR family regulator
VSEEPYEIAICIGRVRNEQLPVRQLAELPRGLYASPDYCGRKGMPQGPAELAQHDCIMLETQINDGLWSVASSGHGALSPRLTTSDIIVAREMAVAGVGIAMLTQAVCAAEVQSGRLVPLLPEWRIPPVVIAAMFLERRHMPLRIRAFIDLMAQAIRSEH